MKDTIANPSIIMLGFGKFNKRFEKFKEDANKKGIVVRELKFFDFQIPINEDYDEAVNFLKQNINPILKQFIIKDFPFKKMILKEVEKKMKLKEFDYKEFDKHFKSSNYYPYGYLGLTPLCVDLKYNDGKFFDNKQEKENYKNLFSLKSKGYKPLMTPTAKDEYFKNE